MSTPEFATSSNPVSRAATIEYAMVNGRLEGTIVFDGLRPMTFSGTKELEQKLGLGAGRLVLVHDADTDETEPLTEAERRIVEAAVAGCSNREIADALFYSVKSVEAYLTRIYRRFGLAGRDGLASLLDGVEDLTARDADTALVVGGSARAGSRTPASQRARVTLHIV